MGRTSKPLKFLVHPSLAQAHPWHELVTQGHLVVYMNPDEDWDLILGPRCWRMDEQLIKYLDLAVKAARGMRYPRKEKK